jgi:hypothetical protein
MTTTTTLTPQLDARSGPATSRYTVGISGSGLCGGYLCLLYAVTPVPTLLVGDPTLHEGLDLALAIDRRRHLNRGGRIAYRTSASGSRVVGAVKVGPASWRGRGEVRILFPPFAMTPGLEEILCEVRAVIDANRVRAVSIRGR